MYYTNNLTTKPGLKNLTKHFKHFVKFSILKKSLHKKTIQNIDYRTLMGILLSAVVWLELLKYEVNDFISKPL